MSDEKDRIRNIIDGRHRFKLKEIMVFKHGALNFAVYVGILCLMWLWGIATLGISIGLVLWIIDHVRLL